MTIINAILITFVTLSFIGTLLYQFAYRFTTHYLVARRGFSLGNVGSFIFIHEDWNHFFGNMLLFIPSYYLNSWLFDQNCVMLLFLISLGTLGAWIAAMIKIHCCKYRECFGLSGVAFFMFTNGMTVVAARNYHSWLTAIAVIVIVIFIGVLYVEDIKGRRIGRWTIAHMLCAIEGIISGIILGLLL